MGTYGSVINNNISLNIFCGLVTYIHITYILINIITIKLNDFLFVTYQLFLMSHDAAHLWKHNDTLIKWRNAFYFIAHVLRKNCVHLRGVMNEIIMLCFYWCSAFSYNMRCRNLATKNTHTPIKHTHTHNKHLIVRRRAFAKNVDFHLCTIAEQCNYNAQSHTHTHRTLSEVNITLLHNKNELFLQ